MKITSNAGKIYDSICFLIEYFNGSPIYKEASDKYDASFSLQCYNELAGLVDFEIPRFLAPFFHYKCHEGVESPVSTFFAHTKWHCYATIDSFGLELSSRSDFLYEIVFERIFESQLQEDESSVSTEKYISMLNNSDYPADYKMNLALVFGNFSYAVMKLISALKNVYEKIELLHSRYANQLEAAADFFSSNHTAVFRQLNKPDIDENFEYAVCLINQFVVYTSYHKNLPKVIIGCSVNKRIGVPISNISPEKFIAVCGSEIRLKIIRAINENGRATCTQIAKAIGCPVTTLTRHLNTLVGSSIIFIAEQEKTNIYYKINTDMFIDMKAKINELINSIINNSEDNKQ